MSLPSRPDLGRLKRLARTLQRSAAANDRHALERLRALFPELMPDTVKLSHAQLAIAREYGSPSWPALVARVHSLAFRNVAEIEHRTRRKHATLTVRALTGRRHVFHELRPHTAARIERLVLERPPR